MRIVDIKLSEKDWQIFVEEREKTAQPEFMLLFSTKKSFRITPVKYEDSDYNRKISDVEETETGYVLRVQQNMTMLPCECGVWHLQASKDGRTEFVKADDTLNMKELLSSDRILYKSRSNSYMYPIVEEGGECYLEQSPGGVRGNGNLQIQVCRYRVENTMLYLTVSAREKIPEAAKLYFRDDEENRGFSLEVAVKTGTGDGKIQELECNLEKVPEVLAELQERRYRTGIEYWKQDKYFYHRCIVLETQTHKDTGYGILELPKQKTAVIPCFARGYFCVFITDQENKERYGYMLDAYEMSMLKLKSIRGENGGVVLAFDSRELAEGLTKADLVCVDRKNQVLLHISADMDKIGKGEVFVTVGQILEMQKGSLQGKRYAVYLAAEKYGKQSVYCFTDSAFEKEKETLHDHACRYYPPIELGSVEREQAEPYMAVMTPYLARGSFYLRFLVTSKENAYAEQQEAVLRNITIAGSRLKLFITLQDHGIYPETIYIKLRNSLEDKRYYLKFSMYHLPGGLLCVRASLDLKTVEFEQFYWDIEGTWTINGESYKMRIVNRRKILSRSLYLRHIVYRVNSDSIAYPYRKKSQEYALYFRKRTPYDSRLFIWKEYLALFFAKLFQKYYYRKNIWLVYEKYCQMAQDNGYYFFKYCMEKLPEAERNHVYYVIDKNSPDYSVVEKYGGHVLDFLSLKHMIYLQAARVLISSDTKAHAYAWHSANSIYRNSLYKKKNVFLQHGVMAFKCCHRGLRKGSANASSLFITSSEFEADIIEKYFEYSTNEIAITGLARWDVLRDESDPDSKEILLMPTWRTWLEEVEKEEFINSDYYQHYMDFLNQPKLIKLLEDNDIVLNFYIHPKFREYLEEFSAGSERVRLIPFGSEPLNRLIMRCSMMITDYSSACWDVYYQGKPVLFYLFDLELYNEVQGSYIDMEKDAFGDSARESEELLKRLEYYINNGFQEKECYAKQREWLLPYRDDLNSKRTYDIIKKKGW